MSNPVDPVTEFRAERDAALLAAAADLAARRPVFGGTGEAAIDWAVTEAATLIAADPALFDRPLLAPLAPVQAYTDPALRERSLELRLRGLRGVASAFVHCNFGPTVEALLAGAAPAVLDGGEDAAFAAEQAAHTAHRVAWRNERAMETFLRAYRYALAVAARPEVETGSEPVGECAVALVA